MTVVSGELIMCSILHVEQNTVTKGKTDSQTIFQFFDIKVK